MRTFQELHTNSLTAAVLANLAGDVSLAQTHATRAAEWDRLDRAAVARAEAGRTGAHRAGE